MGSLQSVSGFSIRNTNNAGDGDRWTTDFQIYVSTDNAIWLDAASGTLEKSIAEVQSILCSVSASVRYVKFEILAGGNAGRGLGFFRPDIVPREEYYFYTPNTRDWLADPAAAGRPSYEYTQDRNMEKNMSPCTGTPGTCPVAPLEARTDCLHLSSMGYISSAAINDVVNSEIIGSVAVGSLQLQLTDNAHF
jgi:hypothetical protein